ncbi:unnamed protein product [Schistocephalus solidus]|uniref:TMEM181 GOLD domain-containing protein n=1 Tax=Schistocephalus solidus TaxID=70667 RepID=A0A183TJC7_SCHSO|nr:unnamed protein product [Schistocephalus solidus]
MRLYFLDKKNFILLSLLFCITVSASILIGTQGPPVLLRTTINGSDVLSQKSELAIGPFDIKTQPLYIYQREIWLSAVLHIKPLSAALSVPFHIYVSIGCRSLQSEVSSNARPQSLMWMRNFSNSLLLTCYGQTCTEKLIAHLPVVGCDLHTFHVNFSAQSATSSSSAFATAPKKRTKSPPSDVSVTSFIEVSSVEFILQTFNPPFSYFELFSRFFAFFSSTLLLMTAKSAKEDRKKYWPEIATSMEQASNVSDTRKLYQIIRQVSGRRSTLNDSVSDVNGNFIAENPAEVWREHFENLLNFDTEPRTPLPRATESPPSPAYAFS